jgi:hypothetical protein
MEQQLDALAAQLRQLQDLEAIRGLIGRYAIGADRKNDPVIMGPLFADDGVWECEGFGRFEGPRDDCQSSIRDGAEADPLDAALHDIADH